jgi:hypothetical protein
VELFWACAILFASLAFARWMYSRSIRAAELMTDDMLLLHIVEADDWGDSATVLRKEYSRRQALQSAASATAQMLTSAINAAESATVPIDASEPVKC